MSKKYSTCQIPLKSNPIAPSTSVLAALLSYSRSFKVVEPKGIKMKIYLN